MQIQINKQMDDLGATIPYVFFLKLQFTAHKKLR